MFKIYTPNIATPTATCISVDASKLGGGTHGTQTSQQVGTNDKSISRYILRKSYTSVCAFKKFGLQNNGKITPFRILTNSGDPNGTHNSNPKSTLPRINQVSSVGANLVLSRSSYGGTSNNGESYYSGNPKYVYDSSNYVRFKKEQSINSNYNDSTSGGNFKATVTNALFRVRH